MKSYFTKTLLRVGLCLAAALPLAAMAQEKTDTSWWEKYKNKAVGLYDNGQLSLMLSGYAHHGRNTYTAERIAELNERA